MPELPEVETVRRGLSPLLAERRIATLTVREPRLRWPIAASLPAAVGGQRIRSVERRAKYLLVGLDSGCLIVHLGMSGSLRYLAEPEPPLKHDHYDIVLDDGTLVRYNDPRRFGSLHLAADPHRHVLIRHLGPEPLEPDFTPEHLESLARGRRVAIKPFVMDARIVVGVGNIYANEALYRAGIHPARAAGRISRSRLACLTGTIRGVLADAVRAGGTTLRDFVGSDGRPGYFRQSLDVYEREGQPCRRCGSAVRRRVIGQRASYFCARCQR